MKEVSQRTLTGLVSVSLFFVTFIWFLIDGGMIEVGGDAISRWEDVIAYVANEKSFGIGHHGLRWSINFPIVFLLEVSPFFHPVLYHLAMPSFGAGVAVLIYFTVRDRSQNFFSDIGCAALVLALMTIDFSERPFSQLLPSGAAVFYMCAALYFLKGALTSSGKTQPVWYLLASLSIFLAYGAKLTMVFFGIPVSVFVVLHCFIRREFFNLSAFIFPLVLGLFIETLLIALGSGHLYGRIFAVMASAHSHGDAVRSISSGSNVAGWGFNNLSDYLLLSPLKYYETIGKYSLVIYASIILIVISKVRCGLLIHQNKFKNCLEWTILGFFFLQVYMIIGVSPYVFPEKFIHSRYQYPLFVLCAIFLVYSTFQAIQKYNDYKITRHPALTLLIPILALSASLIFNSNNIFSKHNNFGIFVTFIHNKVLSEWTGSGGNIGYRADFDQQVGSVIDVKSLDRSPHAKKVRKYVRAVYQLDYCGLNETYIYASVDFIFGLCDPWIPGELVLFYYVTNYEWMRPEGVDFVGIYSDLVR
jgi:hypothetical protein